MPGSSLALIVIPLAVTAALAAWLIMVYYADAHPYWRGQRPAHERPATGAVSPGDRRAEVPQQGATKQQPARTRPAAAPHHARRPSVPHAA
ncbi:MAG: hypothetical protein ACM3ML_32025 [Micromonosporaceae bacterium]